MSDRPELIRKVDAWSAADPDETTRAELQRLLAAEDFAELEDRFAGTLEFGTAGLRGVVGGGPNRMNRAVVRAAERDGKLIAHFAAERPRLQVAKMMRVGLFAAADETRLLGNIAKVLAVSIAPRCRNDEHALVDPVRRIGGGIIVRAYIRRTNHRSGGSIDYRRLGVFGCWELGDLLFECIFQ